jgi:NAD(P)-dependent dehydrogenase (short-subunit alcohol dehydrogenase family)
VLLRCDVRVEEEARGIVTDTVAQLGSLSVLVNHAGTFPEDKVESFGQQVPMQPVGGETHPG